MVKVKSQRGRTNTEEEEEEAEESLCMQREKLDAVASEGT